MENPRIGPKLKLFVAYLVLFILVIVALYLVYDTMRAAFKKERAPTPLAESKIIEKIKEKLLQPDKSLIDTLKGLKEKKEDIKIQIETEKAVTEKEKILTQKEGPMASILKLAISLYKEKRYDKAEELLKDIIDKDPVSLEARESNLYLGFIYQKKGDLLLSLDHLRRAWKLDNEDPVLNYNLGMILYTIKEYKEALPYFENAVSKEQDNYMYKRSFAKCYYNLKDYDKSFHIFSSALKLKPEDPELLYYYGVCARESPAREDIAIESFEKIISLSPSSEYSLKSSENLSEIYRARKEFDKAVRSFKKAISLQPDNYRLIYNLGVLYFENNDIENALNNFERVVLINSNDVKSWENIAGIYFKKGIYNKSLDAVNRVILKEPYNTNMLLLKAYLLDAMAKYDEAVSVYKKVISLDPKSNEAKKSFLNLGVIAERKGDILQAVSYYRNADDNDPLMHFNLGVVYEKQGLFELAVNEYQKAIAIESKNAQFKFVLAKLLYRLEMYEEAERELINAKELGLDDFEMWMLLAEVYAKSNKNEQALELYNTLLERDISTTNVVRILNNKGIMYDRLGQYDRALEMYNIVLNKQPANPAIYHNIGLVYTHMKDFPSSIRMFKKSIYLDPNNKDAHLNIADIFFKIGLYEDAKKEYEKVLQLDKANLEAQLGLRKIREVNL
ncbi:MAG: tetratricopeptide repeat protein [Candidatus Hydrogenedentota bacterium]